MSTAASTYNLSKALLGVGEDQMRRKGSQSGSVRVRGGSWHITFSEWVKDNDGNLRYKQVSRKVGAARGQDRITKREAEKLGFEKFVAPANGPAHCPQGLASVKQFIDSRFRPDHINAVLKKSGKSFYESIIRRHIEPTIGGVKMNEVRPHIVQTLLSAKRDAGLSTQTLTHIRNVLSAMFRHAKVLGFHTGDLPTEGVKVPTIVHKQRGSLTREQVQMLTAFMPEEYRFLVTVLAGTGLRIGEALGLRWMHVNLQDEWTVASGEAIAPLSMLICENWVRGELTSLKTASSRRKIPLTANIWVALMLQRERSKWTADEHPVFAARNGKPFDGHNVAKRHLKKVAAKMGMPWVSWHSLRHSAATMADPYLTPAEKKALLGHTTTEMSNNYTHPAMQQLRAVMEKMESKSVN